MSETMLDKVAKQLQQCAIDNNAKNPDIKVWGVPDYNHDAGKVLDSMIEPTEAMMIAFEEIAGEHSMDRHDAARVWQAMLAASR